MPVVRLDQTNFDAFVSDHETVVVGFLADAGNAASFEGLVQAAGDRTPAVTFGAVESDSREVFDMFGLSATSTGIFRQRVVLYLEPGLPDANRLGQLLAGVSALDIAKVRAEIEAERARAALAVHKACPTTRRGKIP